MQAVGRAALTAKREIAAARRVPDYARRKGHEIEKIPSVHRQIRHGAGVHVGGGLRLSLMDMRVDEIQMKRLKKRKLMLKDQIERFESQLIPDLNA